MILHLVLRLTRVVIIEPALHLSLDDGLSLALTRGSELEICHILSAGAFDDRRCTAARLVRDGPLSDSQMSDRGRLRPCSCPSGPGKILSDL